jgi:hypothetical protein
MSPSRAILVAVLATAFVGCRVPERDRLPIIDETGDAENCPGCFDAAFMLWNLQGALHEGDLHAVNTINSERPAKLVVTLVDSAYDKALENAEPGDVISPYDERWVCYMTFTPGIAATGDATGAMFSWQLSLEPVEDTCGALDPDWVTADLFTELPGMAVTMTGAALDDAMESKLETAFETVPEDDTGEEPDWATQGAPYYIGFTGIIDGNAVNGDSQSHYGRAYQIDEDMNIRLEEDGGVLLTTEQIAAGNDGWFEINAWTFFSPYEVLR